MSDRPSKASILGALSRALDLVEGQPEGHALRTARIALRIADRLGLPEEAREDLYFASVLKDSGCTNNSVRIQKIFGGDEHLAKAAVKLTDWTSALESLKFAWRHTEKGRSVVAKLRRMARNVGTPAQVMNEVTEARCTRGAAIARMLSFRSPVAEAILHLDEHWDGRGSPYRVRGGAIPLLGRILCLSQSVEVFFSAFGPAAALQMAKDRAGTWFDPETVKACEAAYGQMEDWEPLGLPEIQDAELPQMGTATMDSDLDAICEAFAMIVDAKSSFTAEHSTRVMRYSVELGNAFGFGPARLANLRRAALLHDIGKLGVPTGILEKPGRLEEDEFRRIQLHPRFGFEILGRIPTFEYLAEIASNHHERLDGKGYWRGLGAEALSLDVRIVSVCDVFDALSADRPYREAMPPEQVWAILGKEAGGGLDPDCVAALRERCEMASLPLAA